jgi:AraC-like DNA-binding protein
LRKPRTYIPEAGTKLTTAGFRFGGLGLEVWQEMLGPKNVFNFDSQKKMEPVRKAQKELLKVVTHRPAGYEWMVHEIVTRVLGFLLEERKFLSVPQNETPVPVTRVINALLANPARDWKATELAGIAQISYSGLRRLFKNTQQESIHEFIQRTRLDQARMLLSNRQLSIKEVAEQLNFSSEYYFSHFFRRTSGLTPTQFRQSVKNRSPANTPEIAKGKVA